MFALFYNSTHLETPVSLQIFYNIYTNVTNDSLSVSHLEKYTRGSPATSETTWKFERGPCSKGDPVLETMIWLVVEPTQFEKYKLLVKMGSSSPNRDESKTIVVVMYRFYTKLWCTSIDNWRGCVEKWDTKLTLQWVYIPLLGWFTVQVFYCRWFRNLVVPNLQLSLVVDPNSTFPDDCLGFLKHQQYFTNKICY